MVAAGELRTRLFRPWAALGAAWIALGPGVADGMPTDGPSSVVVGPGVVVSVSAPASEVGASILRRGGNAVDAAVATALALAVTYPPAGNLGGGGFMMVLPGPGREPVCIDYRETAPAAATEDMFVGESERLGPRVVGVPGTVRGLALAHATFGRLAWHEVVLPAVSLARDGFVVDAALAESLNELRGQSESAPYTEMLRVFAPPDGQNWQPRDRCVLPDLASTLELLAVDGPQAFYEGPISAALVREMEQAGGLITRDDLRTYEAKARRPIHGTYRGFDVYAPPPPSSGGIALVQMLNMLERFDLRALGYHTPQSAHLLIEVMRRAYLDRARHLGDTDYVIVPEHLTAKEYAAQLVRQIDLTRATRSEDLAPEIPLADEPPNTTHFSVVDSMGMAVSNTYTLEQSYGSRLMVKGHGFLLNNQMGDFNWIPGRTDRHGRIGTEPNRIAPGKRMLSSQTPILVLKEGRLHLIAGSPGGRTIINTVLCIAVYTLDFGMDLPSAVNAARWHHQWLPDSVRFEQASESRYGELVEQLKQMGHTFDPAVTPQGDAHCIGIGPVPDQFIGVADGRISGAAVAQ